MTGKEIAEELKLGGVENYIFEARILCEELCGVFSEDRIYDSEEIAKAVEKRASGYPLQYILGKWWFWDCEFFVDENCLIPRADTEAIVEKAIKLLPKNAYFADLCTGSGCIAISVLNTLKNSHADAYELYEKTLEIAKKNARVIKVAKPSQDKRFDIPAIGMRTLRTMKKNKADLIAVEAGETIIVDKDEVIDFANKNNIVIMAV